MSSIKVVHPEIVWPIRHQVMYPEMDFESIKLEEDFQGIHLALYHDGQPVSVVSLFERDRELQFRKFATVEDHQGKGYGSLLLQYILEYSEQNGFSKVWCNARKNAAGFYRKFGFVETDQEFFKDGHWFVIMEWRS